MYVFYNPCIAIISAQVTLERRYQELWLGAVTWKKFKPVHHREK
jgi:hypothetical protein